MRLRFRLGSRSTLAAALGFGLAGAFGFGVARAGGPADVDALIYTGVLEENGVLVDGETRAIRLRVFDSAAGGTELCDVSDAESPLARGRFRLDVGDCAAGLRASGDAFVEVEIDGAVVGARTPVSAVPFAIQAQQATVADLAINATTSLSAETAATATNADNAAVADAVVSDAIDAAAIAADAVGDDEIATAAVGPDEISLGAVSQEHAPFAPRTFDGTLGFNTGTSNQILFRASYVFRAPSGRTELDRVDTDPIDLTPAGFVARPFCTATHADADTLPAVFLETTAVGADSLRMRAFRLGNIPDGALFRVDVICVGPGG